MTFEFANDEASDTVTFTFSSPSWPNGVVCEYNGAFDVAEFVYWILPDPHNTGTDDFWIDEITVTS